MCCFSFFTEPTTALRCFCNNTRIGPHLSCLRDGFTCESSLMCYVRRFWAPDEWRAFSDFGCLESQVGDFSLELARSLCTINTINNIYFCCNSSDYCNNMTLQLPREMSVPTTDSVSHSAFTSPSASTKGRIERSTNYHNSTPLI